MDRLENNKKTENNHMGHLALFDRKYLQNKSIYDFAIKKTEKLVTALYMVTDCMETDDAIKHKLRLLSIELLSRTHRLPLATSIDQTTVGGEALNRINEIFSLVEVATTLGYISDMNSAILKKEFTLLSEELGLHQQAPAVTLSEDLFTVPQVHNEESVKDKRTLYSSHPAKGEMPTGRGGLGPKPLLNRPLIKGGGIQNQADRSIKILSLIKDKREVSIKDISTAFTDCSEKTIQRELNSLVAKGTLKKIGAKRWSRYSIL